MKNWKNLTLGDFEESYYGTIFYAKVELGGQQVSIGVPNASFINPRNVKFCKEALAGWVENQDLLISMTEKKIKRLISGRNAKPESLLLWAFNFSEPGGNPPPPAEVLGQPDTVTFIYKPKGDYPETSDGISDFHLGNDIELRCYVTNYIIDWDNPDISISNDFA
ncbi:MAG: hypothetical protein CMJ46_03295 [Planctomyces sp.]|nr:hypothetical protein [Planctomyces sp.]